MNAFLALLIQYYACDALAAQGALTADATRACIARYSAVKSYFTAGERLSDLGTPERAQQDREAYAAFKAWEAENAAFVAGVRRGVRL